MLPHTSIPDSIMRSRAIATSIVEPYPTKSARERHYSNLVTEWLTTYNHAALGMSTIFDIPYYLRVRLNTASEGAVSEIRFSYDESIGETRSFHKKTAHHLLSDPMHACPGALAYSYFSHVGGWLPIGANHC